MANEKKTKNRQFGLRMTDKEFDILRIVSDRTGLSKTDILMRGLINQFEDLKKMS